MRPILFLLVGLLTAVSSGEGLPFIAAALEIPAPIVYSEKAPLAAVDSYRHGRWAIYVSPQLVKLDREQVEFVLLHEYGHLFLLHLMEEDVWYLGTPLHRSRVWAQEYEADLFAACTLRSRGVHDPARVLQGILARFSDGGGLTHPPDEARVQRVARAIRSGECDGFLGNITNIRFRLVP